MNTPQDINNTVQSVFDRLHQAEQAIIAASADLAEIRQAFNQHAVSIEQGDLMLDAMTYAVSQSSDPAWQADVRALISKLTGMDSYQVSDLCDEAGR